jgi:Mn2+/Fe2+ NRAMP family transporter
LYVGAALVFFLLVIWLVSFKWIERIFGVGGLFMLVFLVTAYKLGPDWSQIGHGLIPHIPSLESRSEYLDYAYFAVALLSSIMLPYETYFYASGGIEDGWKPKDVPMNRIISAIGMSLGGLLAAGLVTVGAEFYRPAGIDAQLAGSAPIGPIAAFGQIGLLLALLGMFFAFAGATIENCLSVAYNISQFFGWSWGKRRKPLEVPRFTASWIVVLVLATTIITTGLDPVQVVEYSIVFSVVILPLSYFPILRTARDKALMGAFANGRIADTLGFLFLFLVTIAALAALPLLILTHGGES